MFFEWGPDSRRYISHVDSLHDRGGGMESLADFFWRGVVAGNEAQTTRAQSVQNSEEES